MAGAHTNADTMRTHTLTRRRQRQRRRERIFGFVFDRFRWVVFFLCEIFSNCSLLARWSNEHFDWELNKLLFSINLGKIKAGEKCYGVAVTNQKPNANVSWSGMKRTKRDAQIERERKRETKSILKLDLIIFFFPLLRSFSLVHANFFSSI